MFKQLGRIGEGVTTIVALAHTPWGAFVTLLLTVGGVWWASAIEFVQQPRTLTVLAIFAFLLWTYIGIRVIKRFSPNYEYGLTFEGLVPTFNSAIEDAMLGFGIQFRNFTGGAISFSVEVFDVRLGSRTLPRYQKDSLKAQFVPRGGGRTFFNHPFKKTDIQEFMGKAVEGTIEFSILYGAPKKDPIRRFKMVHKIHVLLQDNGQPTFGSTIEEESDEPISKP